MSKMMKLDCGTEIPSDSFSRIFGGGKKKALEEIVTLRIGNDLVPFKRGDLTDIQAMIDRLVMENAEMRKQLGLRDDQDVKPRIRVPAAQRKPVVLALVATEEIWRPIPGTDKHYEVSSFGSFRNVVKGKKLNVRSVNSVAIVSAIKTSIFGNGQQVILNAAKTVGWVFCARHDSQTILHFKDGNRFNFAASNLEWISEDDPRRRPCDFTTSRTERGRASSYKIGHAA